MRTMTFAQACARRLARHGLATPAAAPPAAALPAAAGRVCGIHAQVMAAAELSIALRVHGATRVDVRAALWTDHSLVKTFGPRGTVHLVPAADWAVWSAGLAAAPWSPGALPPALRMTPAQVDSLVDAIGDALADADLTVDELDAQVVARAGGWAGERVMPAFDGMWPRWRLAVTQAAYRGRLCFGPHRGRLVTYADPRRLIPGFAPPEGRAALATIALGYLRAYGPAKSAHFAQWLGIPRRGAATLFDEIAGQLVPVEMHGTPCWLPADDPEPDVDHPDVDGGPSGVRLLPYFDAYTVGCHPRELVFPGIAAHRALSGARGGGQAGTIAVMLTGGVVSGVWHQRRSGRRLAITVEPFGKLTSRQHREVDDQAARVGEILEAQPTVEIGTVTARHHL